MGRPRRASTWQTLRQSLLFFALLNRSRPYGEHGAEADRRRNGRVANEVCHSPIVGGNLAEGCRGTVLSRQPYRNSGHEKSKTMTNHARRCMSLSESGSRCDNLARPGSAFCDPCHEIYADPKAYDAEEARRGPGRSKVMRRIVNAIGFFLGFTAF